jgi:hypothetical protein
MSVKISMKARGSFGSVGRSGLGSTTTHGTDRRQAAVRFGGGQHDHVVDAGEESGEDVGLEPPVPSR